jgi:hypothetical protein
MQRPTRADLVNITDLVRSLRPEWERFIIEAVLQSHAHHVDLADLVQAAVRTASDQTIKTPKAIGWASRHWRDLDTQPIEVADKGQRCFTCGKPERKCLTERPGPDDHPFEPVRREDLPPVRR